VGNSAPVAIAGVGAVAGGGVSGWSCDAAEMSGGS
jgi:hypothetical protein